MRLDPDRYWSLTPRSFDALQKVHQRANKERLTMWAIERADFRNAHFVHKDQPVPWTVDDILSPDEKGRTRRMLEHRRGESAVRAANAQLSKLKPGEDHPLARKWTDEDLKRAYPNMQVPARPN